MDLNIALGSVVIANSALGGIVSAHAPDTRKQKALYISGFAACAIVSIILLLVQSKRTERAATLSEQDQKHLGP
jgi:xanthine/uracil permease